MKQPLTVGQTDKYLGSGSWRFSVWIEGSDEELDAIESVEYFLHPSFRNPRRSRTERASKFRLSARCRGEFPISIAVHQKDGSVESLHHHLTLESPAPASGAPSKAPVVFLSGSGIDQPLLKPLRQALQRRRVRVVTTEEVASDASPGMPFEEVMERAIRQSSSAVVLTAEKPSLWVQRELGYLGQHHKPIMIVQQESGAELPSEIQATDVFQIRDPADIAKVAAKIASRARALAEEE